MGVWRSAGGNTMIIFLAALQGVPAELYEAAEIDGANRFQRFLYITLPMISPAVFFNLTLGIIGALKVFAPAFVATQGGPAYATWFYALHLYQNAFRYLQMGYASALAWIFLVIVLTLTWIQFRTSARWVQYEGETR
jgi:multiple sugar transport system permease protein